MIHLLCKKVCAGEMYTEHFYAIIPVLRFVFFFLLSPIVSSNVYIYYTSTIGEL